ncbi:MAG: hypothetical protein K9G67_13560, partial [Bacteroidales bacterium]|nr:hypothetical protein [Bacteroidales bacterium]MCF8344636.1 hypothetical protein [Bacteroidales bacterium]MCF8377379.1 hypothetical protein [Bacteroidales bacterium]MCF8402221.1 hypothetical protein [Bacteroidales bacterium]
MKKNILLVYLLFNILSIHHAQNWPKVIDEYQNNSFEFGRKITESYDKGYLILADIYNPYPFLEYMWIIKTDINGNLLWNKKYGNGEDEFAMSEFEKCPDGGLIGIGQTSKYDSQSDPIVIKLNACMQIE